MFVTVFHARFCTCCGGKEKKIVSHGGECFAQPWLFHATVTGFLWFLARRDDRFTCEETERPFCMQQYNAKIILFEKGRSVCFVCGDLTKISLCPQNDRASVSVCHNLTQTLYSLWKDLASVSLWNNIMWRLYSPRKDRASVFVRGKLVPSL